MCIQTFEKNFVYNLNKDKKHCQFQLGENNQIINALLHNLT
jgi:hypothetical protein